MEGGSKHSGSAATRIGATRIEIDGEVEPQESHCMRSMQLRPRTGGRTGTGSHASSDDPGPRVGHCPWIRAC
jgi:hypothetical protein